MKGGSADVDGAGGAGSVDATHDQRARRSLGARAALLIATLVAAVLCSAGSALAAGDAEHSFARSFKGAGECTFTEPGGMAVNETTGEIFVFDRATNSVDRFSSAGVCLTHVAVGKKLTASATSEGIAVDNSSNPEDPSKGDVYVVEGGSPSGSTIVKFKPVEGGMEKVGEEIKAAEGEEPLIQIHGIAVDGSGQLWVYQGREVPEIDRFSNATVNAFLDSITPEGECKAKLGFAVAPNAEFFYVGRNPETRTGGCEVGSVVMVKLDSEGKPLENPETAENVSQLDNENTSGVAADPSSGEVYFDHQASISAFRPDGLFVQRFGGPGSPGELHVATGLAATGDGNVYAADGQEVKIFAPSKLEPSPPGTLPSIPLADERQWEQVTPQDKLGAQIYGISKGFGTVQASPDGSAITYTTSAPIVSAPPTSRAPEPTQTLSRRGSQAWETEDVIAPSGEVPAGWRASSGTEYEWFSSDLSKGLVNLQPHMSIFPTEPLLSPEATEDTPYVRSLTTPSAKCEPIPSSCYEALVSSHNDTANKAFGLQVHFSAATPDLNHAVLRSPVPLTAEALDTHREPAMYEWSRGAPLELVSLLPAGEQEVESEEGEDLRLGGVGEEFGGNMRNAISSDGSRVVWSTRRGEGRLFLRDTANHETLRIDKAQGITVPKEKIANGTCEEHCAQAQFQTADVKDTRIFFTDLNPLTADATVETGEEGLTHEEERGSLGDLYVCEVITTASGCKLTNLTASVRSGAEGAIVQGVIGASEDGTYIYYVADGALTANAGRGHCTPRSGAARLEEQEGKLPVETCGLYVAHLVGSKWETKLVATLTTEDQADWSMEASSGALTTITSRVSPKGEYLAFMSDRSLTGYNNVDTNPEHRRDEEVFLYHVANGGTMLCASCKPSGAPPTGVFDTERFGTPSLLVDRVLSWRGRWLAASVPGWTARSRETAVYQSRYLSDTGRLFFNSVDPLVPADENGKMDVYEFEPNGEGTCRSENGCISLMSSGTSSQESAFLDASLSGGDVFMLTSEKLVPQDEDPAFDIYDARTCTASSPCIKPPPAQTPPCASENECKGPLTSVPAPPPTPTSTLPGPGNGGTRQVLHEVKTKAPPETRAQKLAKALKACRKKHNKRQRIACERKARKKYGPPPKHKKKKKKKK